MHVDGDSSGVRFPPPLIFLGALIPGMALEHWLGGPWLGIPRTISYAVGGLLFILGLVLILIAARLFRRAGTAIEPWRTTTTIVSSGLYRWSRNPIYLGMAIVHSGVALAFDSLLGLALLPIALLLVQTHVIAREERYLEAKFGDAYRGYRARVRRWI